jgi:hypothetical protein
MVTEGLPVPCSHCFDGDVSSRERRGSIRSLKAGRVSRRFSRAGSSGSDLQNETQAALLQQQQQSSLPTSSAIDTPPESPRVAALQSSRNPGIQRKDSSFRKTYDDNDKKRAIPCENCALTIPKNVKEQLPEGAPGSPARNGKGDSSSPVLRTRAPYERVSSSSNGGSPKSTSTESDSEDAVPAAPQRRHSRAMSRSTVTGSTISSFSSGSSSSHTHYLDYTSTHDPLSSTSFSILRASCLRTLSCETLPPSSNTSAPPTPTSPYGRQPPQFSSTVGGGGPIFFGDPLAGYTTAFIFRVPDPYARGRRRIYAFICLSTAKERAAMQAFSFLSAAFRELASWIQGLAEIQADAADNAIGGSTMTENSSERAHPAAHYGPSQASEERKTTPTSSFLSGRPCDPDGYPRNRLMSFPKSRGLAELVGRPDFFIELHARFVALLAQLSALFAGVA